MNKKIFDTNPIIVMKFGGTSLGNEKSRQSAINHIRSHYKIGKKIIVVVSAMGRKGEPYATDTLISLMKEIGEPVNPSELDLVISLGETLSASIFAHLLNQNKLPAESFTGSKAGILTDDNPGNSNIVSIDTTRLKKTLDQGVISVVAGFQGVTSNGEIRTLGRGGSDTSAVALGSAIKANFVEIFTDVDGIANCDPNKVSAAKYIEKINLQQVINMTNEGSKVLHPRAVLASKKNKTTIIVRNTFSSSKGTKICHNMQNNRDQQIVLSHREGYSLVEINTKKELKKNFPDMILIDKKRLILKNDIYLDNRLIELKKEYGKIKVENSWATISIVFEKKAGEHFLVPETELFSSEKNITRYLLKEEKLNDSLKLLFDHYKLG